MSEQEQEIIEKALAQLPTVLYNRLSDTTRANLASAFLGALHNIGFRVLLAEEETGHEALVEWAQREAVR